MPRAQLNEQQRIAIELQDQNLIVVAGAGSGKTRVLVERFIRLLDTHPDWPLSSIVAITFTQKAAREMRDRVRREIEARIAAIPPNEVTTLQYWRRHQAALDSAQIGTIDSLCASILRANAAEANLDPDFTVLEDIDTAVLLDEAVEEALVALREQPAAELLITYAVKDVRETLREMIKLEPELLDAQNPRERWLALYLQQATHVLGQLREDEELHQLFGWQPPKGWPKVDDKLLDIWQDLHAMWTFVQSTDDPLAAFHALNRARDSIKLNAGKAAVWGGQEALQVCKEALGAIRKQLEAWLALPASAGWSTIDEQASQLVQWWTVAIQQAQTLYQQAKRARNGLDFTDLERLTRDLLQQHPQVTERYRDQQFKHILVDEFQDTNGAQRDIIFALAAPEAQGGLFVVGDPKQSIYEFRGADVSVFQMVRHTLLHAGGQQVTLRRSYRTHSCLVKGFNAIFQPILGEQTTYPFEVPFGEEMEAERHAAEHDNPALELILLSRDLAEADRKSADHMRQWEAYTIAQRLHAMVAEGRLIWDKEQGYHRPMRYSDVAVLLRSTNSMPTLEQTFKAQGIPYITFAGRGYFDRIEILDLMNLLKALYNPLDDLSLAAALRSPLFGLSDEDLLALRLQYIETPTGKQRLPLWTALMLPLHHPPPTNARSIAFAQEVLSRLAAAAGRITIAELLTRAVAETGYLAVLTGLPDGTRRCANVEKLIDIARRTDRITLGDFTMYLQDLAKRDVRESEALVDVQDMVQIMTIHASKGLEFPVVVIYDAAWARTTPAPLVQYDSMCGLTCKLPKADEQQREPFTYRLAAEQVDQREQAESKRLLYVAMTRAQDYLIISGRTDRNQSDGWLSQLVDVLTPPSSPDQERQRIPQAWGDYWLHLPQHQPPLSAYRPQGEMQGSDWSWLQRVASGPSYRPPLAEVPTTDAYSAAKVMDSSEIAALGEAAAEPPITPVRNQILHSVPSTIYPVVRREPHPHVPQRIIGELVHRVLRWGYDTQHPELDRVLTTYLWEYGLTAPDTTARAIGLCRELLSRAEQTSLMRQIRKASQIYREWPFTLQLEERTITGIIDLLYFHPDYAADGSMTQRWHIVDYKTSFVSHPQGESLREALRIHAQRYYGQLSLYAAAVQRLTWQVPKIHLHYIRYAEVGVIEINAQALEVAFKTLDTDIQQLLTGIED